MNHLTDEQKKELQEFYESLINDPRIKRMEKIPQHRGSNTYLHVLRVAKTSYKMAKRSNFKINFKDLLMGAVLHDYYLYDWRVDRSKLVGHCKNHPQIACKNAKEDFEINAKVENIILSHMWPLNFRVFCKSKEGRVVSYADKRVALRETLTSKKYKQKHFDKLVHKLTILEE